MKASSALYLTKVSDYNKAIRAIQHGAKNGLTGVYVHSDIRQDSVGHLRADGYTVIVTARGILVSWANPCE